MIECNIMMLYNKCILDIPSIMTRLYWVLFYDIMLQVKHIIYDSMY